ncbi:MAG: hypothetical protein IJN92_08680 [Lachnospiraceae bacterium]|nr:hypothetical protein [Lachnospiraceae bacterium]
MTAREMQDIYPLLLKKAQEHNPMLYIAYRLMAECGISIKELLTLPSKALYSHSNDSCLKEPFDANTLPTEVAAKLPKTGLLFGSDYNYIQLKYRHEVFLNTTGFPPFLLSDLTQYFFYRSLLAQKSLKKLPPLRGSKLEKARSFGLPLREYIKLLGMNENDYFKPKSGYIGAEFTLISADISKIWNVLLYTCCFPSATVIENQHRIFLFYEKFDDSCLRNIGIYTRKHDYDSLYKFLDKLSYLAYNGFIKPLDLHQLTKETERLFEIYLYNTLAPEAFLFAEDNNDTSLP